LECKQETHSLTRQFEIGFADFAAMLRAIALNPHDFDAMASLGGVLKRQKRYEEALAIYRQATKASDGNP
jgi:tetratricopeptide (TPR) repeat protein